jgi:hypothetical protein
MIRRRKSLKRQPLRRTPMRRRWRDTGPDEATREQVGARDIWCCVVCGRHLGASGSTLHHRRNRGSGGSSDPAINRPSNLLTVCGSGTTGCHGWITNRPGEARDAGYVVSLNSTDNPRDVPVRHALYGLVYLDDNGGFEHVGGDAA